MRKLTYRNAMGVELTVTNSAPFLLQTFTEDDPVNLYTFKGAQQDGVTYIDNTLDQKDLSLEFVVIASTETDAINLRTRIKRAFNPKLGEGVLIYQDPVKTFEIKCLVNKLPVFTRSEIDHNVQTCLVSLTACSPYWNELTELRDELALWRGDLEFDWEIPEEGVELGHREQSLIINVVNPGDVDCGMCVEFKALATLSNPSILNINTHEYIKVNKEFVAGEIVRVTTAFDSKKVISTVNGVSYNVVHCIAIGSTFMQLKVQDNLFRYDAETGIDNLEVSIRFTPLHLGV